MPRLLAIAAILLFVTTGCSEELGQGTPEQTIASAKKTVMAGRADRLSQFVYAENPDMRRLLNRFGVLLGNVQGLGDAVQRRYPEEVAALTVKVEAAAKDGKATSLLSQMTRQMDRQDRRRRRADRQASEEMQAAFNDAIKRFFADPYGWLEEAEGRMTTAYLTDETVGVLWDGKPILPPLGVVMKRDVDGKWYFVLPTNLPGVSGFMPRTQNEFQVWGGLITVFDKVVVDLTKEVEAGRISTLEGLSRRAGEMALPPAMITIFAYAQLQEIKKKEAQAVKDAAPKPAPG